MSEEGEFEVVWEGRGPHLHDALDDAWQNAKRDGAEPGTYVVQAIAIETENPIRTYVVVIGGGGS
jgi:hypothetical protein